MEKYKNIMPFFLLIILVLAWIFILSPKREYTLKFDDVEKVYTDDYRLVKKYNSKVYNLINNLKLEKAHMPGGAYRFLYIEDVNGKKTIYLFDSGIIGYKKGKEFYIVSNKNIVDKVKENIKLYNTVYLSKPLFSVEVNKEHKYEATRTIKQQNALENIRFTFNRKISYLKIIFTDRIEIPGTCIEKNLTKECEYEYKDKVISNQKYVLNEGDTLDFQFNKETYKYGIKIYITDFNGEVSVITVSNVDNEVKVSDIEVEK